MPSRSPTKSTTRSAKKPPAKKPSATTPGGKKSSTPKPRAQANASKKNSSRKPAPAPSTSAPKLLSGGNPQIPKGYGDAPVQAYIAAMSGGGDGWKRDLGRRLDALIELAVPNPPAGLRKAVKWNSPLYGVATTDEWFLGIHCFDKYIKVAFFRGASLHPLPPGLSKQKHVRYLDIGEDGSIRGAAGAGGGKQGKFDEAQFIDWVKQASKLPGERM